MPDIADECGQMRAPDIDPAVMLGQERQHGDAAAHDCERRTSEFGGKRQEAQKEGDAKAYEFLGV